MIKSGLPKRLWDDWLVLESYIRSNTAHDIYMLSGEVPETIMSGETETSDISQFCEFEWNEQVKFRDDAINSQMIVLCWEDTLVLVLMLDSAHCKNSQAEWRGGSSVHILWTYT